jgi:hypothetical protein
MGKIVEKGQPGGFEVLRDGYAKDYRSVFFIGKVVEGGQPYAFEVLRDGYAKDNSHFYQ